MTNEDCLVGRPHRRSALSGVQRRLCDQFDNSEKESGSWEKKGWGKARPSPYSPPSLTLSLSITGTHSYKGGKVAIYLFQNATASILCI